MKTINNAPVVVEYIVAVRVASKEVSKSDNSYWKIELQCFAGRKLDSSEWVEYSGLTLIRCSEVFHKLYLSNKLSNGNIIKLQVAEHIKGVTEYLDKDGNVCIHSENGLDCISAEQCTIYDLIHVKKTVDIEDYLPYMNQAIQQATRKQSMSSFGGLML